MCTGLRLPPPTRLRRSCPIERSTSSKMSFQMSEHNMDPVTRLRESSPLLLYRGTRRNRKDRVQLQNMYVFPFYRTRLHKTYVSLPQRFLIDRSSISHLYSHSTSISTYQPVFGNFRCTPNIVVQCATTYGPYTSIVLHLLEFALHQPPQNNKNKFDLCSFSYSFFED